jgi:hypothetical protein
MEQPFILADVRSLHSSTDYVSIGVALEKVYAMSAAGLSSEEPTPLQPQRTGFARGNIAGL